MVRREPPRPKPLRRQVETKVPRKTILVFCEGERTEPDYLHELKRQPSVRDVSAVDLQVETRSGGSVPLTLVKMAKTAKDDPRSDFDEYRCVFDV